MDVSRKKQRKLERKEKKERKKLFFQRKKAAKIESTEDATPKKNIRRRKKKKKTQIEFISDSAQMSSYVNHQRRLIRQEEKEIKKYEKLLKLKNYRKRNKLPKSFYMDGLADLIEICDGKYDQEDSQQSQHQNHEQSSDEEKDSDEQTKISYMIKDNDNSESGTNDDDEYSDESLEDQDIEESPEFHEDIYGFLRDKHGNIVKQSDQDEIKKDRIENFISQVTVDENLQRKLRGFLNRLTSSNIKLIVKQIMDLNKTYSKHIINKGIMNCIDEIIIKAEHKLPSKLVAEIAMFIAILYFEMGEDVGGFFVHLVIRRFDEIFNNLASWQSNQKLNNIIALILNIYCTGLIDCQLIYDLIDKFCDQFDQDKSIEMIDSILKTSGFLLRKDDPSKMKSLIQKIQSLSQSTTMTKSSCGNRIKFILESLIAIKNNNISKIKSNETIVMTELIEGTLKGVIKKNRVPSIPGQYSAILQSSHWFSYIKEISINTDSVANCGQVGSVSEAINIDYNLRDQICKALRINTPLRRELFTALFHCNDYLDAAVKLISIGKKQTSEIVNVVIHVAINERSFNNFYSHLLQHLTSIDRKFRLALDFAIRDKITNLESLTPNSRTILQKLMFELFKNQCLNITCLKIIQFSEMNEMYVDFIRNILQQIFNQSDQTIISSILSKIPKKDNFASAIKLFISCFMDGDAKTRASSIKQLQFKLRKN